MAEIQQSILLDAPKEVDIAAIERELTHLWKQAGGDSSTEAAPVVRACSLNLVIVTEEADRAMDLEGIVSQVTVDHPSRIFLASIDRHASAPAIDAWVSARCSLPVPGGRQVCCEEINLVVKGTDSDKVPSIVTSLLVADIPTILIWKAKLDPHDNILQLLVQIADRVLIDSSEESRPADSLVLWGKFIQTCERRTAFGDLAWTHLTQWRTLLAKAFQSASARDHLSCLGTIKIEYSSTSVPLRSGLSQALLAAGWLQHSLQWVLIHPLRETDAGRYEVQFRSGEQSITVQLVQILGNSTLSGGIESICCQSSRGGEVVIRRAGGDGCILLHTSLSGMTASDTVASGYHQSEAELVSRELEVLYHEELYEASVSVLIPILLK